jgi:hypothetical protein
MQANLERRPTVGTRGLGRSVAIFASVPLIATLALWAPGEALAACGATQSTGAHATTGGGGEHAATSRPASSGGSGGGGTLGCPGGASVAALRGLPMAASGRVVETGARRAAHTATHARTAATKTANTSAHLRGVKPPHA